MASEEPTGDYADRLAEALRNQFRALHGSTEDLREDGLRELYRILGRCEAEGADRPKRSPKCVERGLGSGV